MMCGMGNGRVSLAQEYDRMNGATMALLIKDVRAACKTAWPTHKASVASPWVVRQDNDPSQNSTVAMQSFKKWPPVQVPGWPANSADLNPIENLWPDVLKRLKKSFPDEAKEGRDGFLERLKAELEGTSEEFVRGLVRSMPKRIRECIAASGGRIDY
jgi:hypothetical protein